MYVDGWMGGRIASKHTPDGFLPSDQNCSAALQAGCILIRTAENASTPPALKPAGPPTPAGPKSARLQGAAAANPGGRAALSPRGRPW